MLVWVLGLLADSLVLALWAQPTEPHPQARWARGVDAVVTPADPRLGDLVRVDVPARHARLRLEVSAFGCRTRFHPNGERLTAFVAVPTDTSTGTHTLRLRLGKQRLDRAVEVRARDVKVTQLRVDRKFTGERSAALKARLEEERARIQRMWARTPRLDEGLDALTEAIRPVPGPASSRFGDQRRFNGTLRSEHYGLDLRGRTGTPVKAALPGVVALSEDRWGSGGTIYIDHGGELLTGYFHLSERSVESGQRVEAGDRIGAVGATGRVTGPHLHWAAGVRCARDDGGVRGMYVDPAPLLRATKQN